MRDALAAMAPGDRAIGERLHALIKKSAPGHAPKTWYRMPAYAKDGKVVCFFRNATKVKERYAMFGFNDGANPDQGSMWPVAYALRELSAAWRAFSLVSTGDARGAETSVRELLELQSALEQPESFGPAAVLLAHALVELGRAAELSKFGIVRERPWQRAATAIVEGNPDLDADELAAMGAKSFEAQARLEAARIAREAGRTADAESQLAEALPFYRGVGAKAAIREGEALLAAAS